MQRRIVPIYFCILILISSVTTSYALGETQQAVTYLVTHKTAQTTHVANLTVYVTYTIAARTESAYWLQRTTSIKADARPLSITQILLDDRTHQALRYIMYRPANMGCPENVIDLPLSKMGTDEILPIPVTKAFSEETHLDVAAGTYTAYKDEKECVMLWLNDDVPILGVVKAEAEDWTMELFRITDNSGDLLPQKPPKGGIVYLKK